MKLILLFMLTFAATLYIQTYPIKLKLVGDTWYVNTFYTSTKLENYCENH